MSFEESEGHMLKLKPQSPKLLRDLKINSLSKSFADFFKSSKAPKFSESSISFVKSLIEEFNLGEVTLNFSEHDGDVIKTLLSLLTVADDQRKWKIILAISMFGDFAIENLICALRDPKLRDNAKKCLSLIIDPRIKKPHVVDILIEALDDENEHVRAAAAEFLGEIGDDRAISKLITKLKDEEIVREKAKWALAFMGKRSIKYIEPLLRETDGRIRRIVFEILAEIGDDAIDTLVECLKDELWFVRKGAVEALGEIGNERVVEHIKKLLEDRDVDVRRAAKSSLRKLKNNRRSLVWYKEKRCG